MSKFQALFCDDVRVEDSGKYFVVGAYTEMIAVSSFPLSGMFSLLLVVSEVLPGRNSLKVVVKERDEPMPDEPRSFDFLANEDGRATLRFHGIEINVNSPSVFEVFCGTEGEDTRIIEAIPVRLTKRD